MINNKIFLIFFTLLFGFANNIYALKLDRVILSSDNNLKYINFWPITAKAWKNIVGVIPTLALIANSSIKVDKSFGDVIRFEPIENIPTGFQAQVIRLLLPVFFPNSGCITSDIDMIPLQKDYFINYASNILDKDFLVYRKGIGKYLRYSICYTAAKGAIFGEIFNLKLDKNIRNNISKIIKEWFSLGWGWGTDERILYQKIHDWSKSKTNLIKLDHVAEKRLDRGAKYNKKLLENYYYIDCHMPRPYNLHKLYINSMCENLGIK